MVTTKGQSTHFETLQDLKPLLSSTGPCLSVYMPLSNASTAGINPNGKQNELRWRECLRLAEERAPQFGNQGAELLNSVKNWADIAPETDAKAKSIAVFRCGDQTHVALLDEQVQERAVMGPHFYIRPLLASLLREKNFYLLGLSRKNTRLLRCTNTSAEEVPFPADVKNDFELWMNQVKPDHNAVNNGSVSAGSGGRTALAPKGSDDETKDELLLHFFKQIDHGVAQVLHGKSEPLVLCAVEYELVSYREVNSYPHLAKESVTGAPNGLKSGEMHTRAFEALERCYETKVDDTLAEWNHKVGGGASSRLKDVITASHDGRVLTLLVSDSLEQTGVFDEETRTVKGKETGTVDDQDLVNDAVVQTILHAGKVLLVPHRKMPNGAPLAAIFRY